MPAMVAASYWRCKARSSMTGRNKPFVSCPSRTISVDEEAKGTVFETWSDRPSDGCPAIANFIAGDVDHDTYVFRKFSRLKARNLIYLQGELVSLEAKLQAFDTEVARSADPELLASMRNWDIFEEYAQDPSREAERNRKALATLIEAKLKKYRK
jgi:hypothetical protein